MAEGLPRVFAGRYEVGELIGRGGMAEVYIGRDNRLGRTVAIKALRTDFVTDATFQARFRREAQSAASLNHPSIVSVYDSGEEEYATADGTQHSIPFIIMEYVEGHTVRDLVRDGSALPIDEAIEITIGVLNALEYSHHSGIVHRDIKPANVMLTPTGAIKVMDFGIARVLADPASAMTQTQAVVGTAQYLSPEQARGESVDARSDLYSTGCLLYELLTGQPPFTGDSPVAVAYQHVGEQAPLPSSIAPDVPEALDRITMKALAKDRDARYSSAASFRADLEAAARSGVVTAPAVVAQAAATEVLGSPAAFPPVPATTVMPQSQDLFAGTNGEEEEQKSRAWIWVLLIALLVIGAVATYFLLNRDTTTEPEQVEVPELSQGMTEAQVREALREANLEISIQDPKPHDDIAADLLIEWDPESGTLVEEGSEVKVWFSTGPDAIEMIDVLDLKKEQAQKLLLAQGFDLTNIVWETENVADKKKDIVSRTEPSSGVFVAADEKITVYLATGLVEVPNVVSMDIDEARAALPKGIRVNTNNTPVPVSDYAPGTVLSQDKDGLRPVDELITLEVAEAAPEPEPEPEPEPTTEPEPEPEPSTEPEPEPTDEAAND